MKNFIRLLMMLTILGIQNSHASSFGNDVTGDPMTETAQENMQNLLQGLKDNDGSTDYVKEQLKEMFKKDASKDIFVNSIKPGPTRPEAIKGCVTHTNCTGEGKDKTCETWEVCVSN